MASLVKVGRIYYGRHITGSGKTRREVRKSFKTDDERRAHKLLNEWEAELEASKFGERPKLLFETVAQRFIHERCRHLRASTVSRYTCSLNKLRPFFKDKFLLDIDSADLERFVMKRRKDPGRSWAPGEAELRDKEGNRSKDRRRLRTADASIRRDLACLNKLMNWSKSMKWLSENTVSDFMKEPGKAIKNSQPRTRYLTHEEEQRLIASAAADRGATEHDRLMLVSAIVFAIDTGLRQAEQFRLQWRDVQKGNRPVIAINETKTYKARKVPLWPRVSGIADDLPMPEDARFVFWRGRKDGRGSNKPFAYGSMKTAFNKAVKRAGLEDLNWHDLRRTCGCRLIQDHGFTLMQVRDWLGHKSVAVTEKHYAFLAVDNLLDAVELKVAHDKVTKASAEIVNFKKRA
jgi:integrase/recombinase XerD